MNGLVITEPCAIDDLDEAAYHADPVEGGSLSHSMAKKIVQPGGPAKLRAYLDGSREHKKEFDFGTAAHSLVLGTGAPMVAIPDEYLASNGAISTKAAKDFVAEARANGQVPLKSVDVDHIKAMALQIIANSQAMAILEADGARHEVSAFRVDDATGLWLRNRFDTLALEVVGDYKTAASADPAVFLRKAYDLGYHMQAGWYLDMALALELCDPDARFRFIVQEKDAPYLVSVIEMSADYLAIGRADNCRAIELYAECIDTDRWPGYGDQVHVIDPPAWLVARLESTLDPITEAELLALLEGSAA